MSKILGAIVALAAAAAATLSLAGPAAAAPQSLYYTGPGGVFLHSAYPTQTSPVVGKGYGNGNPATITSLSPAVCTVAPTGPGTANVTFGPGVGVCQLRFQVAGGGGYDPIDNVRPIYVIKFGF